MKQMDFLKNKLNSINSSQAFAYCLIVLGVFLRLHQYLYNRSLWIDEAMLSVNIVNRNFSELLQPLDYRQNAPLGFLFLTKLSVEVFGNSEYALRLPSLIIGIVSIFLFYKVATNYLSPRVVPLAVGFFSIANPLIYYASEVKQYIFDLTVCLLIYWLIVNYQVQKITWKKAIILGVIGALLIWFSFTSIFILAGVAIVLAIDLFFKKEWQNLSKLLPAYLMWFLSFVILNYCFLSKISGGEDLQNSWLRKQGFAPIPFVNSFTETFKWYIETFQGIFVFPGGFETYALAAAIFLTGCFWLLSRKYYYKLLIFLSPIFITLLASAIHKYPFATSVSDFYRGRLILFLTPSIIMIIAEGLEYLRTKIDYLVFVIIVSILFLQPTITALNYLQHPRLVEEARPVIQYVLQNHQESDLIYLNYRIKHQFDYYRGLLGFKNYDYKIVRGNKTSPENYLKSIENLQGNQRIWLLFSFSPEENNVKEILLFQLNMLGKKLDAKEAYQAAAYLYELS